MNCPFLSVWPGEQVVNRRAHPLTHPQGQHAPPLMLRAIMNHVAALAKRFEVARHVVRRVVVEARHDTAAAVRGLKLRLTATEA